VIRLGDPSELVGRRVRVRLPGGRTCAMAPHVDAEDGRVGMAVAVVAVLDGAGGSPHHVLVRFDEWVRWSTAIGDRMVTTQLSERLYASDELVALD